MSERQTYLQQEEKYKELRQQEPSYLCHGNFIARRKMNVVRKIEKKKQTINKVRERKNKLLG